MVFTKLAGSEGVVAGHRQPTTETLSPIGALEGRPTIFPVAVIVRGGHHQYLVVVARHLAVNGYLENAGAVVVLNPVDEIRCCRQPTVGVHVATEVDLRVVQSMGRRV